MRQLIVAMVGLVFAGAGLAVDGMRWLFALAVVLVAVAGLLGVCLSRGAGWFVGRSPGSPI